MNHAHVGGKNKACTLCFAEIAAEEAKEELRRGRFWVRILVGFSLALAGVAAFVLYKIGMGRIS